jgi:cell division protein FtsI (penicillin-binding protein 3)
LDVKKDILWRVYLIFLGIVVFSVAIIGKAVYIQQAEGKYWRSMSDSLHLEYRELDAERGTIFSEDGAMLSTSIPYFDIRIDFGAEGLRDKSGKRFRENLDSLCFGLGLMFSVIKLQVHIEKNSNLPTRIKNAIISFRKI